VRRVADNMVQLGKEVLLFCWSDLIYQGLCLAD
jgi:hypothetical protein